MLENPYRAPSGPVSSRESLGDIIFPARDRRSIAMMLARGEFWPSIIVQILFVSGMTTLLIDALVMYLLEEKVNPEHFRRNQIIGASILLGVMTFFCTSLIRRPRRGSLALHERGFRYRKVSYPFDRVESIRSGRTLGGVESALASTNQFFGQFSRSNRRAALLTERSIEFSWTIVFKDGRTEALKWISLRTEPDDLRRFLDLMAEEHPEIKIQLEPTGLPFDGEGRSDGFFDRPLPKMTDL